MAGTPKTKATDRPLLDKQGLAARLNTSLRHVDRLVSDRQIPYVKVGHFVRFDPDAVDAWIRKNSL